MPPVVRVLRATQAALDKLGARALTLVIEETLDPEAWLIITGWEATVAERRMLEDRP